MTYDGILQHHRTSDEQYFINFGDSLKVKPLNIIKFPVSKYESIYRSKRLNGKTPYHIYSALFAYEFTTWMANIIATHNPQKEVRIGVIAAYKAQADMIDRLVATQKFPSWLSIQTGTIHGFQGDECEIIIAVYNPPPYISAKKEMFLNKKNIINVSISRARDYLFVLMPDDMTENVGNLFLIKKMEKLIKETCEYTEYDSHDIEKMMFGSSIYLESNTFSTTHQNVNVYDLPEQKYEIRTEDSAIDIQLHKTSFPDQKRTESVAAEEKVREAPSTRTNIGREQMKHKVQVQVPVKKRGLLGFEKTVMETRIIEVDDETYRKMKNQK